MPIINDPRFLDKFAEELGKMSRNKKSPNFQEWDLLLPYCEQYIDNTNLFLQQLAGNLNYQIGGNPFPKIRNVLKEQAPNNYSLVNKAFEEDKRIALLANLAAFIHYYVWQYSLAKYGNVMPNPTPADVAEFHNGNTRAKHAVETITQYFQDNITLACQRIKQDWDEINDLFFPNLTLLKLLEIEMTGSDFHKKGKQVFILTFRSADQAPPKIVVGPLRGAVVRNNAKEVKLVYKPSDVELDCRLVGDTTALSNLLPNLYLLAATDIKHLPAFNSLFQEINNLLASPAGATLPRHNGQVFQLPLYRILPRRPGSDINNLAAAPPISPPINDSYGYIEYLTHNPDWNINNNTVPPSTTPINIGNYRREERDWLTRDISDLKYFYRIFGWYIAIAIVFGLADSHHGNLVVSKRKPYLIDLEISFKWRTPVIDRTGLQDVMSWGVPPFKCQLFYWDGHQPIDTRSTQAATHINNAISEAINFIDSQQAVLITWLTRNQLDRTVARYTTRATRDFGDNLTAVYRSSYSLMPIGQINLQQGTVANINGLVNPQPRDAYEITDLNGTLNPGNLPVTAGDIVEFDGNNWLKYINPMSVDAALQIEFKTVIEINNILAPANGKLYVVKGANGQLNGGILNVIEGNLVQREGGNWVKRANYGLPFFNLLVTDSKNWYQARNQGSNGRPNFATSTPEHDWECYRNCDYPVYYRRLGSMDLLNARGRLVTVNQASYNVFTTTAFLDIPGVDANGKVNYTAVTPGIPGLNIRICHATGNTGLANLNRPLAVNVVRDDITVTFATDASGNSVIPSATDVVNLINADANAKAKVKASAGGTGASNVGLLNPTNLNRLLPNAFLDIAGVDANGKVTYTAVTPGIPGLNIRICHANGNTGLGNLNRALAVNVAGNDITVTFGTDGIGNSVIPTATNVVNLINADPNASAKVQASAGGTGASAVNLQRLTNLNQLQIAGSHYFDYDIDSLPAVNAIQMVTNQITDLQTLATLNQRINDAQNYVTNHANYQNNCVIPF